jgi:hypothetical protein
VTRCDWGVSDEMVSCRKVKDVKVVIKQELIAADQAFKYSCVLSLYLSLSFSR